ncbi:sterile alpha motif domain-containing protein 10-like isoform X2 [Takifugu flavidus]|nr:sterile alpha motif domain-containing protein 10-like isoform X2 [Takifugu flavidus]
MSWLKLVPLAPELETSTISLKPEFHLFRLSTTREEAAGGERYRELVSPASQRNPRPHSAICHVQNVVGLIAGKEVCAEQKEAHLTQRHWGVAVVPFRGMDSSKRVSMWSVQDVLEWLQDQHPSHVSTLQRAFIKHAISGRALLRLRDHHLERLGLDAEEHLQEILQDLLLLRVQEEINELKDLHSGEEAPLFHHDS